MSIFIKNAWILSQASSNTFIYGGVLIHGQEIREIMPSAPGVEVEPPEECEETFDAEGMILIPGLVNAHYHSYSNMLKGTINDRPLDLWSLYTVAYGHSLDDEDIRLAVLLGTAEMMKAGITGVIDHFPHLLRAEAALEAYEKAGIRVTFAPMLHDVQDYNVLPLQLPEDILRRLNNKSSRSIPEMRAYFNDLVHNWHGKNGKIRIALGPNAPQRCSEEMFKFCREYSLKEGLGVHMHLLETNIQRQLGERLYPSGMVHYLDKLGLLNAELSVAHAIWLGFKEIELLAQRDVTVIHNPASNLILGSGRAPIVAYKQMGVNIALGTDAANCGGPSNLFEIMRLTVMLHRLNTPNYKRWLKPKEVFEMATLGSAAAMGMRDKVGIIAKGSRADLVLLKSETLAFSPLNDLLSQLVHQETGSSVDSVMINGQWTVRGGRICTFDEVDVMRKARDRQLELLERCNDELKFAKLQEPYFEKMYRTLS